MNTLFTFLLMQSPAEGKSDYSVFLFLILIVVVFYFFMIRPQTKKAKDEKKYREAIKVGDKIITVGGIHGKILEVKETAFVIEVEGKTKLKVEKSSVSNQGASADLATKK